MTAYKLYLVIMKEQKTTKKKNRNMRDPLTDMYNSLGIGAGKRISMQQGGRNMKIQPAVKKKQDTLHAGAAQVGPYDRRFCNLS